jgi:pilus assembly protein Flp/PilA
MELQGSNYMLERVLEDESGQGLVEYAMIILLVSIVVILALTAMGTTVSELLESVSGSFP